jgi:hypothetical protein
MPRNHGAPVQLAATTMLRDCGPEVLKYLASIGHRRKTIRQAQVFVRYHQGKVVAVGPTPQSVEGAKR